MEEPSKVENMGKDPLSKMEDTVSKQVLAEAALLEMEIGGGGEVAKHSAFEGKVGDACGPAGRFIIAEKLGEGNFSTVYRCKDSEAAGMEYAVKFARTGADMRVALKREVEVIGHLYTTIGAKDPEGIRCLLGLAFFEGFEHEGHFGAAFELMKYNLRTALLKYGAGRGLPLLPNVRNFGRNIFLALRVLRQAGLLHCDVKPENLLMSRDNESVKLCDFGSSMNMSERVRTDKLQPRNFRSPEVILGQDYGTPIDVWSAGATLYEIATDRILFPGETNNDVILEMLKVLGAFPARFSTSGSFALNHFHANSDFLNAKGDMAVNSLNPRIIAMTFFDPPMRPLPWLLEDVLRTPPRGVHISRHEGLVQHFVDLLGGVLRPDPESRTTPESALAHNFFQKGA